MNANVKPKTIFTGDNLPIMRGMNSESVDLIYLDPPFNSNANYAAPIGSEAAGAEFKDTWTLHDVDAAWLDLIETKYPALNRVIHAAMSNSDKSYLIYMAVRLLEMHRILKATGSIYLHCDPTMSHYLKLVMDAVFGKGNFLADITWKRYAAHSLSKSAVDTISDHLLYYAKDNTHVMANKVTSPLDAEELNKKFPHVEIETGRRFQHVALEQNSNRSSAGEIRKIGDKTVTSDIGWRWNQSTFDERIAKNPYLIYWTRTGKPRYKIYADEYSGSPVGNIWTDIPYLASGDGERTGYPTQKPVALLERIIKASSNQGDMVLDPFCGCATTLVAADRLQRDWIGIDISAKAAELVVARIKGEQGMFEDIIARDDIPKRTDLGNIPRYNAPKNRTRLYGEQGGNCNGCGTHFESQHLEIDHIIAKSVGGTDHIGNLQLLCGHCNRIKGDRGQEYLISRLNAS